MYRLNNFKEKLKHVNSLKSEKTGGTKSLLDFVLQLIGSVDGSSFLNQSEDWIAFHTRIKIALTINGITQPYCHATLHRCAEK